MKRHNSSALKQSSNFQLEPIGGLFQLHWCDYNCQHHQTADWLPSLFTAATPSGWWWLPCNMQADRPNLYNVKPVHVCNSISTMQTASSPERWCVWLILRRELLPLTDRAASLWRQGWPCRQATSLRQRADLEKGMEITLCRFFVAADIWKQRKSSSSVRSAWARPPLRSASRWFAHCPLSPLSVSIQYIHSRVWINFSRATFHWNSMDFLFPWAVCTQHGCVQENVRCRVSRPQELYRPLLAKETNVLLLKQHEQ